MEEIICRPKAVRPGRPAGTGTGKPIEALDLETGEVVGRFPSAAAAGRVGFHKSALSLCLRAPHRQHKGYHWRYAEPQMTAV